MGTKQKVTGLNRLTARTVANLTKRGRHADGAGLYLQIDGKGVRQWTFLFQREGRRREMALGPANAVTLARARELAAGCRATLAAGRDPLEERRTAQEAERRAEHEAAKLASGDDTFRAVMETMLASREKGWRNAKHRQQWRNSLETYAAELMPVRCTDIRTENVLACLQPIWGIKAETASRVRGRIETVLNAARARDMIPEDRANPARWRGHLDHLLPKRNRLTRGHHPALPFRDLPGFMTALRSRPALTARALEFLILTAARSGEVRGALWDEFDLDAAVWTVPAARTKAGREHRVPLSDQALEILKAAGEPQPGRLVFSSPTRRPLSDMAFAALLTRMGNDCITAHGFRSTFRDWVGEVTSFPREVAEAALAHTVGDAVERAYRRGDALEKRRELMAAWANYCYPKAESNVVPIRA